MFGGKVRKNISISCLKKLLVLCGSHLSCLSEAAPVRIYKMFFVVVFFVFFFPFVFLHEELGKITGLFDLKKKDYSINIDLKIYLCQ